MSYDRNKPIALAVSELEYHEKASNSQLDDKYANSGSGNWTKYGRDLDALGDFYNGPKNGFAWCDQWYDWLLYKCFGKDAAMKLLCQPKYSAGAGCYYSALYYKQHGQFYSPGTVPEPADQIFFTYAAGEVSHTGIVEKVVGNTIYTIEGNTSDGVYRRSYKVGSSAIYGYGRPKWEDGGADAGTDTNVPATPSEGKTVDELAQEVIAGKWGTGAERVAALTAAGYDYTAVQTRVNEILSGQTAPAQEQKYTVGQSNEETIFNFCKEVLGMNTAAACGVLANIDEESRFQIGAIGDGGTSFGICQWHASRYSYLKSWCAGSGKDYTTLDGQLWYMKHELETTHASALKKLLACADTEQGAEEAGYAWCSIFEVPANTEVRAKARGALARSTYWPKYTGQTTAQTPTAPLVGYAIYLEEISEGATGSFVKAVQTLLILRGYSCGHIFYNGSERADGEFGPKTKQAVMDFQKANGLEVDGTVGAKTMTALLK